MDATILLCNSTVCRLCAEENDHGTELYGPDAENLSALVNKYLPLRVEDDGKLPGALCPGCTIQLEATRSFFDLIVEGQRKLRDMYTVQQDALRQHEKQKAQLEDALKIVNPKSTVQTYSVGSDEAGEKIFIQILSPGPLFPPHHELSLRVEGLDKPRKKRGRPPKVVTSPEEIGKVEEREITEPEEEEPEAEDGKRRRRIKKPLRYSELIQGKELDRVFKEEGVLDENESSDDEIGHPAEKKNVVIEEGEVANSNEIIGHMQGRDGENLGSLVVVNKIAGKTKPKSKNEVKVKKFDCDVCGKQFLHVGRLDIHRMGHKNVEFKCGIDECDEQFVNKAELDEHRVNSGHVGLTLVENVENYGQVELPHEEIDEIEVKQVDSSRVKLFCAICDKKFSCKQNYETHVKSVHENHKPFACDKCDKKFPYSNSLKQHMLQHTEKSYPCETCEKIFNHPSSLVYHREAEHNNGRKFVCNKCKKCFKHKQLLLRHQLVHTDERPHVCHCGASFKTKANLLNHMPTHTGEKKFTCNICEKTFAHKTSLTLHIRLHKGQKPYECDVCMKTFSQKGNLAEHRRIHTGEKPYSCNYCQRKFTTSSQYKLHVKRHTGEKPWKCEYCSKSFLHKDTWKCHTRRHRNERPYQCSQCLRGFTEQWALKKHERLHTGEKPYSCDICLKSFADSSNLTKHKKIHSGKSRTVDKSDPMKFNETDSDQILYVTYQDNQTEESFELMDGIEDADRISGDITDGITGDITGGITDITDDITGDITDDIAGDIIDDITPDMTGGLFETTEILSEPKDIIDMHVQHLIDNDGNPISLTSEDGQLIKVVSTIIENEQSIQGLMPDGTLVPINLTMTEGKTIGAEIIKEELKPQNEIGIVESELLTEEEIRLSTETGKLLSLSDKLADPNISDKIEFLTEDGQNVCFITTYNLEESGGGLSNQFINIQ